MPHTLILIRHAETLWNLQDRIQGHSDIPLSDRGLRQAERLAQHIHRHPITAIYASDLLRARQTAEIIAASLRCAVTFDPALREILLGAWEGLTPAEVNRQFDQSYEQWKRRPSSVRIPGAEPVAAFHERTRTALRAISRRHPQETVAVVTHGGVIAGYLADILQADFDHVLRKMRLDNTGLTIVEWRDDDLPFVAAINDYRHLHGLTSADGHPPA